ncbi:MAG: DUF4198 domain-containing protein [Planctomycetaceae bacterium]|jgi:hypothetical protein|nr:DUF4198 domain-containing protein [Planctomycetaceae bacterium]
MHTIHYSLLTIILLLVGCSRDYGMMPVSGVVLLDGKPAAEVSVTFSPRGATGNAAGGFTDAEGRFTVSTGGLPTGSGALAGEYDVLFHKVEISEVSYEESVKGKQATTTFLVPEKYTRAATSGIDPVKVEKGGKNNFVFNLTTK